MYRVPSEKLEALPARMRKIKVRPLNPRIRTVQRSTVHNTLAGGEPGGRG